MAKKRGLIYRTNLVRPMVPDPMKHVVDEIEHGLIHIRLLAEDGLRNTINRGIVFNEIMALIGDTFGQ